MKALGTRRLDRKRLRADSAPEAPGDEPLAKRPRPPVRGSASGRPVAGSESSPAADTDYSSGDDLPAAQSMELSVYERKRLKNIQENAKFFASLNMLETAKKLWGDVKKARQRKLNPLKKGKPRSSGGQPVVRRSMRLQILKSTDAQVPELPIGTSAMSEETEERISGPIKMVANDEEDNKVTEDLINTWLKISQGESQVKVKQPEELKIYKSSLKRMMIQEHLVAKVTPKRVSALAIHPSEQRFLVAAGSTYGYVGIWDLSSRAEDAVVAQFKPHCGTVNSLCFSPSNSAELLSVSNDGSIRCGNIAAAVFDEVYVSNEWNTSSFDFLAEDGSTLIVSHWDGEVAIVDRRTPSISGEQRVNMNLKHLRTINIHPVDRHYFVTAASQCASIYDIRNLKASSKMPVAHVGTQAKSINSAYFSPVTGKRVVTTSMDDRIRVFDTSTIIPKIPCVASITHNNNTGRWLTKFRAVWDPKMEDCFVVGSMVRPRQIEVFHSTGIKVHEFKDAEWLASVCSINVMHPTKNILVGGNSSGRLHVFMDKTLNE
ncbi:WD repeat-containing protein 76 isoform X1 [Hypanus sabinus]|uniref:WD repeat-containing protein 76 isoform X1 n=1 Tax=Hypanus sabinus TaxID=79690 RepID=UPI0028C50840|nr:WD repeat-containing protein 76 isoform X1 [Hypanus sabinus]